eukprot:1373124-Amorphochlora_amoeboformis.AAC.1
MYSIFIIYDKEKDKWFKDGCIGRKDTSRERETAIASHIEKKRSKDRGRERENEEKFLKVFTFFACRVLACATQQTPPVLPHEVP